MSLPLLLKPFLLSKGVLSRLGRRVRYGLDVATQPSSHPSNTLEERHGLG